MGTVSTVLLLSIYTSNFFDVLGRIFIVFDFFITQILGMKWLSELVHSIMANSFGLNMDSRLWGSVHFFIYDAVKIMLLLFTLIFMISYIQSYFPPERTKRILTKFDGVIGNTVSALLGTVTPFCSCSSVPIFIGFTRAGLPIGLTFSFLISSPLVDAASMLMLMSFFGARFSIAYVVVGIVLAILGGLFISSLKMEKYIREYTAPIKEFYSESEYFNQRQRLNYAKADTFIIVKNIYRYIFIGVGLGAFIHNWIPQDMILAVLGSDNIFAVLIATFIGIPIYADLFGAIPIAEALYLAGVPAGTILALMMAITALSLPSILMLSKVLKPKLLGVFVSIIAAGIMLIGYGFNLFSGTLQ